MIQSTIPVRMRFLSLVLSLPTNNPTARMRIWRALKALGCGVLRDGVYLLPESAQHERSLQAIASDAKQAGGNTEMVLLEPRDAEQSKRLYELFDRQEGYRKLYQEITRLSKQLTKLSDNHLAKGVKQLRKAFEAVSAIDFFAGEVRSQVEVALSELEAAALARLSPDEPHAAARAINKLDPSKYRKRIWATRKRPWVDRLGSAWLIRRFIDQEARFMWLASPKNCPKSALGFDFDGATFTHVGSRATFETLLACFDLERDSALFRVAAMVHYLDVGGLPVADAPGVESLLVGARKQSSDDDELLREAMRVFDFLYAAYSDEP